MRPLLAAALVLLACPPVTAQDSDPQGHTVGPLTLTLPASFESVLDDGVREIEEGALRLALFADSTTGRMVSVAVHSGQSWWWRFRFKRGYGARGQTPHEYRRVDPDTLPLAQSLAETVGAAFTLERSDHEEAAVLIRGCSDETCYAITAGGPSSGSERPGLEFASLLSGVNR